MSRREIQRKTLAEVKSGGLTVQSWKDSAANEKQWSVADTVTPNPALVDQYSNSVPVAAGHGASSTGFNDNYTIEEFTKEHFKEYVNPYKECFFWVGVPGSRYYESSSWRDVNHNGLCQVAPSVRLYSENEKFAAAVDLGLANASDNDPFNAGGIMSNLTSLIDAANALGVGSKGVSRTATYTNPKIYKNVKPLSVDGEIKFTFRFGQAGLFSGLEEVVKPVMAITNIFTPSKGENVPYPSQGQWSATYLKSVVMAIKNKVSGLVGGGGEGGEGGGGFSIPRPDFGNLDSFADAAGELADAASEVQKAYFDAVHDGAATILASASWTGYRFCFFQWGSFKIGPCVVGKTKFEFDMSLLDEEGWPAAGSVTLSGIETFANATREALEDVAFAK